MFLRTADYLVARESQMQMHFVLLFWRLPALLRAFFHLAFAAFLATSRHSWGVSLSRPSLTSLNTPIWPLAPLRPVRRLLKVATPAASVTIA